MHLDDSFISSNKNVMFDSILRHVLVVKKMQRSSKDGWLAPLYLRKVSSFFLILSKESVPM